MVKKGSREECRKFSVFSRPIEEKIWNHKKPQNFHGKIAGGEEDPPMPDV